MGISTKQTGIPFTKVKVTDKFWAPKMEVNRLKTIPANEKQCRETGRLDCFKPEYKGDLRADYEKHAATSALVNLAYAAGTPWTNGREVFNAAAGEDKRALAILDDWIYEIAAGIMGLIHVFDPETVIIGGGVSAQEDLLIKPLRDKILGLVQPDFAEGLEIKAATLGNNAGMAGAVKYFMDRAERRQEQ